MDVKNNLTPHMDERGMYEVVSTNGGEVPAALSNQKWTSNKEAFIAILSYFSNKEKALVKKEV